MLIKHHTWCYILEGAKMLTISMNDWRNHNQWLSVLSARLPITSATVHHPKLDLSAHLLPNGLSTNMCVHNDCTFWNANSALVGIRMLRSLLTHVLVVYCEWGGYVSGVSFILLLVREARRDWYLVIEPGPSCKKSASAGNWYGEFSANI